MTRAFNDTTSTCATCIYFAPDSPDGGPPDGHCNWLTLPAYAYKNVTEFNTYMRAADGKNCWLHSKRHTPACATQDSEFGACTCEGMPAVGKKEPHSG